MMRLIVTLGTIAIAGALGYAGGNYYYGEMGMKLGIAAGIIVGAIVATALNRNPV